METAGSEDHRVGTQVFLPKFHISGFQVDPVSGHLRHQTAVRLRNHRFDIDIVTLMLFRILLQRLISGVDVFIGMRVVGARFFGRHRQDRMRINDGTGLHLPDLRDKFIIDLDE